MKKKLLLVALLFSSVAAFADSNTANSSSTESVSTLQKVENWFSSTWAAIKARVNSFGEHLKYNSNFKKDDADSSSNQSDEQASSASVAQSDDSNLDVAASVDDDSGDVADSDVSNTDTNSSDEDNGEGDDSDVEDNQAA